MRMRWVLSWKDSSEAGQPRKAKARLVLLGFTDKDLEHLKTESPTPSRRSRMLFYQLAANRGWPTWMGDVTAAFLQGDDTELERELFAEP
eukprot:6499728-Alexandrium_andersonii.AAC.1